METVTVRDLRNNGAEVLGRVVGGESLVVTRDGAPVAELRPLGMVPVNTTELIARRANLPQIDPNSLRADVDSIIDQTL